MVHIVCECPLKKWMICFGRIKNEKMRSKVNDNLLLKHVLGDDIAKISEMAYSPISKRNAL